MKTLITLAMAALTTTMMACAAEAPTEETGQTEDHYDIACASGINAPMGSAAWREELQKCFAASGAGGGGGGYDPGSTGGGGGYDPGTNGGGGGGQSCSQSTRCTNGSCSCSAGPNKGQTCDASKVTGATSCSVVCRYCR